MKKKGESFKHSRFYLISIGVSLFLLCSALGAIKGLDYILMKYCAHEVEARIETASRTCQDRLRTTFDNLEALAGMLAHLTNIGEAQGLNLSSPLYVGAVQDSRNRAYGGPVLKSQDYPEIDLALEGERALGYYDDKGLLFTVPVAYSEENASLNRFAMYRRYVNRQGRAVFLPALFENKGMVALCTLGDGELIIANSQALYERMFGNSDLHDAILELGMRADLADPEARLVSSSLGDFFVYSIAVPDSPMILTGTINAEYFGNYFKDLFYALGIGFIALLLIFNLGLLLLHFGSLKREQVLLQEQRKLVERYAYKVTPPILDLVDSQANNPDEGKRAELEGKGQEILANTAKLREETMLHQALIPPSQHEYTLQNLLDMTFEDLKHRDKVRLMINPALPENIYGDPEAISRFFNSFLDLMLRFKPQNLTFQLDGTQPDAKHVNFEVRVNTECKALERKLVMGLKQSLQTKTEDLKNLEPHTLSMAIASRIIKDQGGTFSIDALPQGGLVLNFSMLQKVINKGHSNFIYKPLPKDEIEEEHSQTQEVHGSQQIEMAPPVQPSSKQSREEVEFTPPPVQPAAKPAKEEVEFAPPPVPPAPPAPKGGQFRKMVSQTSPIKKPVQSGPVIAQPDFKASGMSYNRPEALKFAAGNAQLYDKFKKMFAEYAQRKLPLIEVAYKNELWSEYITLLTGIGKGAHSIGAQRLDSLCKDLVRAAKHLMATVSSGEKDASFIKIHHAEMMDLLADIIADIER